MSSVCPLSHRDKAHSKLRHRPLDWAGDQHEGALGGKLLKLAWEVMTMTGSLREPAAVPGSAEDLHWHDLRSRCATDSLSRVNMQTSGLECVAIES